MTISSKPCPCGMAGCRHVILLPMYVRMRKEEAEPLVKAANLHDELVRAAEDAYFILCRCPRASAFRIASDRTRARLRDVIASARDKTPQEVQDDFEGRAAE